MPRPVILPRKQQQVKPVDKSSAWAAVKAGCSMRWRTVLLLAALCCVAVDAAECKDKKKEKKCLRKAKKGKCTNKNGQASKLATKKCRKSCGTCKVAGVPESTPTPKELYPRECPAKCDFRNGASPVDTATVPGICTKKEGKTHICVRAVPGLSPCSSDYKQCWLGFGSNN